jgi:uncharacterized protein (DUF924 family)
MTNLAELLTPDLYQVMVAKWFPFSKSDPIDFGVGIDYYFNKLDINPDPDFRQRLWPTLKAMSELDLDNVPDMMSFLPPVEHPDFPLQALGLQLVLDQAPRLLFDGINIRWTDGFFGPISIKYARQLQALPAELKPTLWSRWKDSVSVDYFIFIRLWFGAPWVHNESTGEEALQFTEDTRAFVEQLDLYGFPKMLKEITAGAPGSPCSPAKGWFFLACLMDVHYPPLKKFGRYPYRNGAAGREHTPEEAEWSKNSGLFRELPDDVRRHIREDVANDRWTPLIDE